MKKLNTIIFMVLVGMGYGYALDYDVDGFDYKVSGGVVSATRFGLSNNKTINESKAIYPNNSFWSLSGNLGVKVNLTHGFEMGLKGIVGGVAYDSTRDGSRLLPADSISSRLKYNTAGRFTEIYMPAWGEVINAYLSYQSENFGFKVGRYDMEGLDWFSGHNEGIQMHAGNSDIKAWALYSYGRSSAGYEWLNHFTPRNAELNRFGIFVFGVDAKFNAFFVQPYVYYQPGAYVAPGFKVIHDKSFGSKYRSKTTFMMLGAIHEKRTRDLPSYPGWGYGPIFDKQKATEYNPEGYIGRERGDGGVTLFVREEFYIKNHYVGGGFYKNFGNPNSLIGAYGNPLRFNTWVYTLYDVGPTWSDFFGKDSTNLVVFGGSKYDKFSWNVTGRLTYSPRSNERSLALMLSYIFSKNINVDLRLEYMNDETKKGYSIFKSYLTKNNYRDKSFVFMYINYVL
ncbi:outer membrane family protein [Helicobacter sp. 11S03491-1]|uniref:outer membrane family protein n=1 Tax=Helicobacter sp. 11S03491-1 TaxID=1476196 RepID=UPI000BD8DEB1|nr:outer membrane family protein [Helicobacter sp. 11S03491-1]PAF42281.1 hypothetical protein BKH45_04880 [Helicobacter sp. 11S03491-1]